ncbi:hypothetical protein ACTXG7_28270 [Mycolicibacterium sp. Dal123E01]|uniref:hypothetical protein n=1 Tax=Mycolicibacterium sp. Dal123E01 TaxID=3457578 RepID=UPI00403E84F3
MSLQMVIAYLCIAALVAGGGIVFAAWSRKNQRSPRAVVITSLLAGAVWPLVLAGLAQGLLVYGVAKMFRSQRQRTSEVFYYGPPAARSKVNAA